MECCKVQHDVRMTSPLAQLKYLLCLKLSLCFILFYTPKSYWQLSYNLMNDKDKDFLTSKGARK